MQRKLKFFNSYSVLFLAIALGLVFSWYKGQQLLAVGEESLPFYEPDRATRIYGSSWYETGTGYPMPVILPRKILFDLSSFSMNFFPNWFVEAMVFWAIILTGCLAVFFLTRKLLANRLVASFAAVFYLLNLYSQSQVWGRFLYTGMFAWAYLPLFLLLFITWIQETKPRWLIAFLLSSVFFSAAFGQPAYLFTFWVPAFLFLVLALWAKRNRFKEILRFLYGALVAVTGWFLVNIWWIYPYVKVGGSAFGEISDWKVNFDSLRGVSQYFPTSQILLLRQSFLFGSQSQWFSWYNQDWVLGLSVLVLAVAVLGWFTGRRSKNWLFLTSLAFVGWFISKGSNPPFGYESFAWLFANFPATAALRNPYEKFGLVWILPYSVFFAQGLGWIYTKFKPKFRALVVGGVLILSLGVLVWPMWTGDVFAKNARVRPPHYYKEANEFLNLDKSDGRILMLPAVAGDGVRYTWGYQGVEPSEFLFDRPAVSKILRTKYFDDKYLALHRALNERANYELLLEEMNIKYLILHRDYDKSMFTLEDIKKVESQLSANAKITFLNDFGELSVYQFNSSNNGKLFVAQGSKMPQITYQKLSPTRYLVNVGNAKEPFTLIFKETFNELWEARIGGEKLADHFLVYEYANGWKIEKSGDYSIDIVFKVWPWE